MLLHLVGAFGEGLLVRVLRERPFGHDVVDFAEVVATHVAVCVLHAAGSVRALQRDDLRSSLVQVVGGDVLASDSLEELRLEVEVATVVAVLRRALRHRPYPVAQRERVMQYVGDDGPPAEVDLVVVDRRVVLCLVERVFAAPQLSCDLLLELVRKAALQHVLMRVDHWVAVEDHVQQAADLAIGLNGVVNRPAAVVDEAACRGVEPLHVVPALAPHDRAMAEIGHLVVVLGDVREQLDHDGRVVVLELLPVEHVVLVSGQVLLENASRYAVGDVAVKLSVVAPQTQIVHRAANNLVPNEAVFGRCLDGGVLA